MKKAIAICLILVMLGAAVLAAPTGAANDVLTVTANGENARSYAVGEEIVFFVGLDTGDAEIINGEGYVTYDADYLELIPYQVKVGRIKNMKAYSFPYEILSTSVVLNTDDPGMIKYNFTSSDGVGTFTSFDQHYLRFRFRVKAAGTADISHTIRVMCDYDENYIYYNCEPTAGTGAAFASKTMRVTVTVGDVNGDGAVNLRDAVILDRYIAGWDGYAGRIDDMDAADLDRDGAVGHTDALILDRYVAGWKTYGDYIIDVTR